MNRRPQKSRSRYDAFSPKQTSRFRASAPDTRFFTARRKRSPLLTVLLALVSAAVLVFLLNFAANFFVHVERISVPVTGLTEPFVDYTILHISDLKGASFGGSQSRLTMALGDADYDAVLLVPAEEALREMYRKLGYRDATRVSELSCGAADAPLSLRAIGPEEYAALRREFLPAGSVVQEGENLRFLSQQAQFYTGEDFLLAAYTEEETLHGMELLGDRSAAPGIVSTLECKKGHFRTPGTETPFAMIHPLTEDAVVPEYFGFAFD